MKEQSCCETCANYVYDEESACYYCDCDLDEDEMQRFLTAHTFFCPYYESDDEYRIVRKQN